MTSTRARLAAAAVADPRCAAVVARDPQADGRFVYSVKSTGVYCRPSCAARAARPENVAFDASADAARRTGFRPCRRCRPDEAPAAERQAAQVATLCRSLVEAPGVGLDLPLDVRGTAFHQRVWQALRQVPAGQTVSYSEIAARIGAPASVRAVAQACGANPLALAIPCHRVVRRDGAASGHRWGVERKRALLAREAGR